MHIDIRPAPMEGIHRGTNIANSIFGPAYCADNELFEPGTLTVDWFANSGFLAQSPPIPTRI